MRRRAGDRAEGVGDPALTRKGVVANGDGVAVDIGNDGAGQLGCVGVVAVAGHLAGGVDGLGELATDIVLEPSDGPCVGAAELGDRGGGSMRSRSILFQLRGRLNKKPENLGVYLVVVRLFPAPN